MSITVIVIIAIVWYIHHGIRQEDKAKQEVKDKIALLREMGYEPDEIEYTLGTHNGAPW